MQRRTFVLNSAVGLATLKSSLPDALHRLAPPFRISLAQWSFHKALFAKQMDHLDFARVARRDYGIEAIECVARQPRRSGFPVLGHLDAKGVEASLGFAVVAVYGLQHADQLLCRVETDLLVEDAPSDLKDND